MTGRKPAVIAAEQPGRAAIDPADSYLAAVLSAICPLTPRHLSLEDADGTALAEDVRARCALPSFDNSAMDGYAVLAADIAAAAPGAPVTLPVGAEIAAGDIQPRTLTAGTCMRIMTGALMPAAADAAARVEWTDGGMDHVTISRPARAGAAARRSGGDARPGQLLPPGGTRLDPAQIGLLAAAARDTVLTRGRPRLAVVSAGNELVEPGKVLIAGQTWESNSFMPAAARQAGCVTRRCRTIGDDCGRGARRGPRGPAGVGPADHERRDQHGW